jgi:hypothetical protein
MLILKKLGPIQQQRKKQVNVILRDLTRTGRLLIKAPAC